jgi:signal transduction histidine kinase
MSNAGFWHNLFSPEGFMPRRFCGLWTPGEIYLHNTSDFLIWSAYLAIPVILLLFAWKRKHELPFRALFVLFGLFIVSCGTTHFMEIVMFYYPVYRLAGLLKFITAVVSWATVISLVPAVPRALAMRSPDALEIEVRERTAQLEEANRAKDDLLVREQSARREAEEARHEAEEARELAENANRAKDEFLMTLSHELRTPLNAIQGWTSLLRTKNLDETMTDQAMEVIERNCWAQVRLVDDILEVSRIITGKLVIESNPVELAPLVRAAYGSVEPAARAKGVELKVELEDSHALVSGDAARLQQVVWNLLSNAIKFTPKGGQVSVALRRRDSFAEIEVRDSGEGIEPEFLPHVFDRFRQADSSSTRSYGGLGLGLAIVRHLVEMHGGQVEARSEGKGQGATFSVLLPLRAVGAPSLSFFQAPAQAGEDGHNLSILSGLNIVVVDDEAEARGLVSTILQLHGAQTRMAGSTAQAWQELENWNADLLVSDVGMPGENGYQLMKRIRASGAHRDITALALTAYVSAGDRQQAMEAGFDSHLSKPVMPDSLVAEIARLAGRK